MDGISRETQGYEEDEDELELMKMEEEYEEDVEEDLEELGELIPPKVTTWTGADGELVHGIVVFNDDLFDAKITCQMDDCPICSHPWTCHGKHRLCCLPCGHMYGLSCINKWLLQRSSCGKCPQCNTSCSYKDVILLHAHGLSDRHKASSARYFPFTKQAYKKFKIYELSRRLAALRLLPVTTGREMHVRQKMEHLEDQYPNSMAQWNYVKKQLRELEQRFGMPVDRLGQADDLKRQADALKREVDKMKQRHIALDSRASALDRRLHELDERVFQYRPRLKFFAQMYKEHQREIKKKTQRCTVAPTCPKK